MGANSSTLIDDLHASAQLPDEVAVARKLSALHEVQKVATDPEIAVQIVEHGGMQPLLMCYNAAHPHVRVEAAKALAVLAQQPSNQLEMGQDDVLPQYHPAILTASIEFREHAMALLAQLATQEVNKMKLAHEGLVGPIMAAIVAPNEALQLHALDALAKLCTVAQIAELATTRGVLPKLLKAARSPESSVKLAVVRVMTGIAACAQNLSPFISSGAMIFLIGCTYCGPEVQLEVARCMRNMLQQTFEGTVGVTEREAQMLAVMAAVDVSADRIIDDDAFALDVRSTMEMPIVELIPDLVSRTKKLINCDRASIFILNADRTELSTILAENTEQITIPADVNSMAGECVVHGQTINQHDAYKHASFNSQIDKKTGYRTRAMLVMPIRKPTAEGMGGVSDSEQPIGVVQCINKLSSANDDAKDENDVPVFSANDEKTLAHFCRQIAPILEKVTLKKRAPKSKHQLGSDWVQNIATLASLDVYSVVKVVLDRMRELVNADRASLFVLDRKRKELWSKISDELPEIRVKSNAGIVGAVATNGSALNIEDAYKDPRFNRRIDMSTGYRTRTILCLPMKNQRGEVVGVIQCINKKNGMAFTQEDHSNLDEFAWQVATMLEFKAATREAEDSGFEGLDAASNVSTGDGVALLLHLVQSSEPEIQLNAATSIGFLSRNEANRERVVALGGVPVLLELAMPWPWRDKELLRGIALSMANLSMSPAVRLEAEQQGGWKSLLTLAQSTRDEAAWFDSLRALANLALHPTLQRPLLSAGALETALQFVSKPDPDLRVQAARLAGNLSQCVQGPGGTLDTSAAKLFARKDVIKAVGDACMSASLETLPDYAAAYAKLAHVPEVALWLFDVAGTGVLEAFKEPSGPAADELRVKLVAILGTCLKQRANQRIVLDMLKSNDPTEPEFRDAPTSKQRLMLLRERDALRTGKEVRQLMLVLLSSGSRNPAVYTQYARMLMALTTEPSNHAYMMRQPYIDQLVRLADGLELGVIATDAQAPALRGLRLLAEESAIDDILPKLATKFNGKVIPLLMRGASATSEEAKLEVCRLVRALAQRPEIANRMVQQELPPPPKPPARPRAELERLKLIQGGTASELEPLEDEPPPKPTPFLAVIGALLSSPSLRLQVEACAALEPFAADHKVAMCQAKVVGALIALSQTANQEVAMAASRVLKRLQ